jgi:hypothetical protein
MILKVISSLVLLGIVVGIFLLQNSFYTQSDLPADIKDQASRQIETFFSKSPTGSSDVNVSSGTLNLPEEGIVLRDVNLGDTQVNVLETAGIDTKTFVISKEMLLCAETRVGADVVETYVEGAAPTAIELAKLLPCLGAK